MLLITYTTCKPRCPDYSYGSVNIRTKRKIFREWQVVPERLSQNIAYLIHA
jgi:hypothetical protein